MLPKTKVYWDVITPFCNKTKILKRANFYISEIFKQSISCADEKWDKTVANKLKERFLKSSFDKADYKHSSLIDCFNFFTNLYSYKKSSKNKANNLDVVRLFSTICDNDGHFNLESFGIKDIPAISNFFDIIIDEARFDKFVDDIEYTDSKLMNDRFSISVKSSLGLKVIPYSLDKVITNSKVYESYCVANPLYLSKIIEYNDIDECKGLKISINGNKYIVPKDLQLCSIQFSISYLDAYAFSEKFYKLLHKKGLETSSLHYIATRVNEEKVNEKIVNLVCKIVDRLNNFITGKYVTKCKDLTKNFLVIFLTELYECKSSRIKKIFDYIDSSTCLVSGIYGRHCSVSEAKYFSGKNWKHKKMHVIGYNEFKPIENRYRDKNDTFKGLNEKLPPSSLSDLLSRYVDFNMQGLIDMSSKKKRDNSGNGITSLRWFLNSSKNCGTSINELTQLNRFDSKDNETFVSSKESYYISSSDNDCSKYLCNHLYNSNFPNITIRNLYIPYIGLIKEKGVIYSNDIKYVLGYTSPFDTLVLQNELEFSKNIFQRLLDRRTWLIYKELTKKLISISQFGRFNYTFASNITGLEVLKTKFSNKFSSFHLCSNPSLRFIRPVKYLLVLLRHELTNVCQYLVNYSCYNIGRRYGLNNSTYSLTNAHSKIGIIYKRLENVFYKRFLDKFKYLIKKDSENPKFMFTCSLQNMEYLREYALKFTEQIENIKYALNKNYDKKDVDLLLERFISYFVSDNETPFDLDKKINLETLKNELLGSINISQILYKTLNDLCCPVIDSQNINPDAYKELVLKSTFFLNASSLKNNAINIEFFSKDVEDKVRDICRGFLQLAFDRSVRLESSLEADGEFEGLSLENILILPEKMKNQKWFGEASKQEIEELIKKKSELLETHLTYCVLRSLFFQIVNSFTFCSENKFNFVNFFIPKGKVIWNEKIKNNSDGNEERLELFDYGFLKSDDEKIYSFSDEKMMRNKPQICIDF